MPVAPGDPLGSALGGPLLEAWRLTMLMIWNAGLWLLRVVLELMDGLLTPDLSEHGPASSAYRVTFWCAISLLMIMVLVQLAVGLLRRDGRGLGGLLWGCGKFVIVWAGWLTYGTAVVAACGAITRAVLREMLRVDRWADWHPERTLTAQKAVDVTVATVLGLLGVVVWLAALLHLVVMIGRAATLLVLTAVTPIAATGLVGEVGRGWFWKTLRWFHAAALTPVLTALMLGIGVQITNGTATGLADGPAKAVGTAVPGVMLIFISAVAPLALFRLLAFVDPATPSGASFRQALASAHDLRSLTQLGLPAGGAVSGAGPAGTDRDASGNTGQPGQSGQSGQAADDVLTQDRFTRAEQTLNQTQDQSRSADPPSSAAPARVDVRDLAGSRDGTNGPDAADAASGRMSSPGLMPPTSPPPAAGGAGAGVAAEAAAVPIIP